MLLLLFIFTNFIKWFALQTCIVFHLLFLVHQNHHFISFVLDRVDLFAVIEDFSYFTWYSIVFIKWTGNLLELLFTSNMNNRCLGLSFWNNVLNLIKGILECIKSFTHHYLVLEVRDFLCIIIIFVIIFILGLDFDEITAIDR